MLIWTRHLTWSAKMAFGESWQNTAAPKNSSTSLDNCITASTSFSSPTTVHWMLLPKPKSVDKFSMACDNFSLTISTKKTEVMHQPAPGKPHIEPNITIKRQQLKVVEKFTNLSSTLPRSIVMDDEVKTRLAKASAAFDWHNKNVWNWRDIWGNQNCETWTNYQWHMKKLKPFHMTSLRKILSITWQKHNPDTKVLTQASLPNIYTILMQLQLRWASHVVHMKDHCLPKKLIYSELSQGKHS